MTENIQIARSAPITDTEAQQIGRELYELRQQRGLIDEQIHRLLGRIPNSGDDRPTWGPCTRCGHVWRGHWPNRPPRGCPQCGSTGWREEPHTPNSRRPSDPPNPRWGKYKARKRDVAPSSIRAIAAPGLTPPPRLEDVSHVMLVPPPQVRFAEPSVNPMQMIANEWLGEERFEAIETDGTVEGDDDE